MAKQNITQIPLRGKPLIEWAEDALWNVFEYGDVDFQPVDTLDIPPEQSKAWIRKLIEEGATQEDLEEELDYLMPLLKWLNWYSDFPDGIQVPSWGWSYWLHNWLPRKIWDERYEDDIYLRKLLDRVKRFLAFLHEQGAFSKYKTFEGAYKRMTKDPNGKLKKIPYPPEKPHTIIGNCFQPDGISVNVFHFDLVLLVVAFVDFKEDISKLIRYLKSKKCPVVSKDEKLEWAEEVKSKMDSDILSRTVIQQRDIPSKEVQSICKKFYEKEMPAIAMKTLREKRMIRMDE